MHSHHVLDLLAPYAAGYAASILGAHAAITETDPWAFGWESLVATATFALALVTAGLAFFTWRMMRATRDLANRSRQDSLAQLTPYVSPTPGSIAKHVPVRAKMPSGQPAGDLTMNVANLGKGPAIDVKLVALAGWNDDVSQPTDLAANAMPWPLTVRIEIPMSRPVECRILYRDLAGRGHQTRVDLEPTPGGAITITNTVYGPPERIA